MVVGWGGLSRLFGSLQCNYRDFISEKWRRKGGRDTGEEKRKREEKGGQGEK